MGTIAQQLQDLVSRELGLSASGVAEKLGLSRQAWHYARTSTTSPHVHTIEGWLASLAEAGLVARVVVTADGPTVERMRITVTCEVADDAD